MRKTLMTITLASLVGAALPMLPTAAFAQAAQSAHYSVTDTPVGKLIDDPAAAAILQKLIPTVWANDMFQSAGRDLTLKAIQQYHRCEACGDPGRVRQDSGERLARSTGSGAGGVERVMRQDEQRSPVRPTEQNLERPLGNVDTPDLSAVAAIDEHFTVRDVDPAPIVDGDTLAAAIGEGP
jgi:hypothetical protein